MTAVTIQSKTIFFADVSSYLTLQMPSNYKCTTNFMSNQPNKILVKRFRKFEEI